VKDIDARSQHLFGDMQASSIGAPPSFWPSMEKCPAILSVVLLFGSFAANG
jgi:hypothetical protein